MNRYEHISSEQKIKQYFEQLYREMLNGFMLCEILMNRNGIPENSCFLDINPAFERLMGIKKENIIGKNMKEVLPWLEKYVILNYKKVVKCGKPVHSVQFFKEIDKYCEINAYSPKIGQFIMLFTDITKYRKAEEEKKDLQSQLIQSQKLEGIGRLAGGIAHDFNNLLTAILGYTDLALLQIENQNQLKESLQQIRFATQRAAKLVHQLLIFSRKEPMEFKPHNLSDIIDNLSNMLKRIIGEDITVSLELNPDLWISKIDRTQIEQVIMNLAINARDAMTKGGRLVIKTENVRVDRDYVKSYRFARMGKFVCFTMEDTGIGMSEENVQKIFEPFFTTKKSGEGTGLGLSVVYGIIKEHQGWITVSSKVGKGSIFKMYLPACYEKTCFVSRASSDTASKLLGNGEKILFVEDDKAICQIMKKRLSEKGYIVLTAGDGKTILDIFNKENYNIDLLFIDIILPDKLGIELVDLLLSYNPKLKVLLTSGYLDKKAELRHVRERQLRFIEKPYTQVELLRAIKESLGQKDRYEEFI